jgi:hypothetical protein
MDGRMQFPASPPARRRKRGRTVLLWALGAFVSLQLAASCGFDYAWPSVRFPAFYAQVDRFASEASPPDLVCLGSSRLNSLLREAQTDRVLRAATGNATFHAFSACVPGGDVIVSERMFRCLIDQGARPRVLLIEISPEIVNQRADWLLRYGPWFIRWHEIPAFFHDMMVTRSLLRFAGSRFLPLYYYRDQARRQLSARLCAWCADRAAAPPSATPAGDGRTPGQRPIAETMRAAGNDPQPGRLRHHRHIDTGAQATRSATSNPPTRGLDALKRGLRDYRPGGNAAAALERLLSGCRAHGIMPILVVVPAPSGHRACFTSKIEQAFQTCLTDLARKYPCRCADYHDTLADCFFADHHHASREGGLLFTQKLSIEVLAPIWHASADE